MLKRRTFIEGMAALGVVTVTAPLISCQGGQENAAEPQQQSVYRFQTRNARTCNACRNHQHYKVFLDEATADQTRAHPGCNCRIVTQQMPLDYWETISDFEQNGVIDLRAVFA